MSRKYPWEKWHWRDWKSDPCVRRLHMTSRAIWFEILGDMWLEETDTWRGTREDLARQVGCTVKEADAFFDDAEAAEVCDVKRLSNGEITLLSRRRAREENSRENNRLRQLRHRERGARNDLITIKNVTRNGVESETEEDRTNKGRGRSKSDLTNKLSSSSSGKPDASKKKNNGKFTHDAVELVEFFNERIGTAHRPRRPDGTPTKTTEYAIALLKHGYSVTEIKKVTLNRMHRWRDDEKMAQYLRPSTVWRLAKFDEYLGELEMVHARDE